VRLADDHRRAAVLAEALSAQDYVQEVLPVETNIVIFTLREQSPAQWAETLKQRGILAIPFGPQQVRMVTHLGVNDSQVDRVVSVLETL
jgi:threonine aldolase